MWPFVRLTWRDMPRFVWLMLTTPVERELQGSLTLCRQRNSELLAERAALLGKVEVLDEEVRALRCVMAVRELEIPKLPGEVN